LKTRPRLVRAAGRTQLARLGWKPKTPASLDTTMRASLLPRVLLRRTIPSCRRALSAEVQSSGGAGISDRLKSGAKSLRQRVGLSEEALQKSTEKMEESRAANKSFGEATSDAIAAHRQAKNDENYVKFRDSLLEVEKLNMEVLRKLYQEGLDATDQMTITQKIGLQWDKLRGGDQAALMDEQKEELRTSIQIIDAMTPAERRKPMELLNSDSMRRIATKLALADFKSVKSLKEKFAGMAQQHEFYHREAKAGRPLPINHDELHWMMQLRPPKMDRLMYHQRKEYQQIMMKKQRRQHEKPPYQPDEVAIARAKRVSGPRAIQ